MVNYCNGDNELLAALKDMLRIAKAASIGIAGNKARIERAEAAIGRAECDAKRLKERSADLLAALREIVSNDPFNQSSGGIIARAAIAKAEQP